MHSFRSLRLAVALGFVVVFLGGLVAVERSPVAMETAATRFLSGLTPAQRQQAALPFDSDERFRWHYIPTEIFPRKGITIKAMTEPQRKLAHDLLKSGLSQRGYLTAAAIMDLETVLRALEEAQIVVERRGSMVRDPERYFFSVFGTPSAHGTWGWRVDGHHVSLNFTVVKGTLVASSPSFFGSNPAEVRDGPKKGLRILGAEEDAARALLLALDESQRKKAVINSVALDDIVTTNTPKVDPLPPAGITAAAMGPKERELLMRLVDTYASAMASDIAADRMAKLRKAGVEKIAFAWAGEAGRGKKHYYRVQGPTFLIEYDNTQNDANHIHSVWRDFDGDFGRDLLRDHLRTTPH